MSAQLPPEGPAPPARSRNSHVDHQLSLVDLPENIISRILDHLRPTGSVTSFRSSSMRPDVSRDFFQSRASLANVVPVSRLFFKLGIPYLYHTVVLSNEIEVLQFFSEIARHPYRRSMVKSLAWVTVLYTDDTNMQSAILRQRQADVIAASYWDFIEYWPHLPVDFQVAKMKTKALVPLLYRERFDDSNLSYEPSGVGFLAELQHLTVEALRDTESHISAEFIIFLFLTNSPLLRRVELKGELLLRSIWDYFKDITNRRLLTDDVKELVLLRAGDARDDILAMAMLFPRLVSLQAEYEDPSYRPAPIFELSSTISSALLRLADTLETLSLTTSPSSHRPWTYVEDRPSSLTSPHQMVLMSLKQMGKLKNLTTECIWIFGSEGACLALHLPYLLPPNLVRFRLIDFWGAKHEMPPEYPDSLKYRRLFLNRLETADFYSILLMTLVGDNAPPLPDLREVTLVSKHLCEELQAGHDQGDQGQAYLTGSAEEPLSKLRAALGARGIQFKLEMPVETEAADRFDWARIG